MFKNEVVDIQFQLLEKSGKLKLPKICHPDEVGKLGDPNYCTYHGLLGHPTKSCYQLEDILHALVDARALKLRLEQKTVLANTTSSLQFGQSPPVPALANPIPSFELESSTLTHICAKNKGCSQYLP